VTYYRGTKPYPHPTDPTKVLCYVRNRRGTRVCVSPVDGEKLRPYDLFQNQAGRITAKTITGKQFLIEGIGIEYTLYRHVIELP
jgi:hypothetical protein